MTRIQPGNHVQHVELSFGVGIVRSIDESCVPVTAVVEWQSGQQSACSIGYLQKIPAYAAGGEL